MHVFNYSFLHNGIVNTGILNRVANIENLRGSTDTVLRKGPVFSALEERAFTMSVIDSDKIEGIETSEERAISIIHSDLSPEGDDEKQIAGYRDALRYILEEHDRIKLDKDEILKIYSILMGHTDIDPVFKKRNNAIVAFDRFGRVIEVHRTVPADETEKHIDQLIWAFWEARDDADINKLLLIPCFIMDFLVIHPFIDGNGRMSRLLTALLLCQEGYDISRYVSMDTKIYASRSDYYDSLNDSEVGWFDNTSDYSWFLSYFLSQLFLCYRELDRSLKECQAADDLQDA